MLGLRIVFTLFLCANYFASYTSLKYLEYIIIFYLFIEIFLCLKKTSIPTLLFIVIYVFVTSSALVAHLLLDSFVFDRWRIFNELYFYKSINLVGISYASIFASLDFVKIKLTTNRPVVYFKKSFYSFILILAFISLPISLYSLFSGELSLMVNEGYNAFTNNRKGGGISRFLILSLSYFLPWLIISVCLLRFIKPNFFSKISILIIPISVVLILISGDRTALSIVIVGFFISYDLIYKFKVNLFKGLVFSFLLLSLFYGIQNVRAVGYENISSEVFFNTSKNDLNFIQSLPLLMSNQLQCLPKTIELIDKKIENPRFGLDFVRSSLQSLPFGTTLLKEFGFNPRERKGGMFVQPTQWISYHLNQRTQMSGVGFLMIAEFFLNFGIIGVFILPFSLVFFIESTYRKLLHSRKIDASNFMIKLAVFLQIIIWIRNDSTSVIFSLILISALTFLSKILTKESFNYQK